MGSLSRTYLTPGERCEPRSSHLEQIVPTVLRLTAVRHVSLCKLREIRIWIDRNIFGSRYEWPCRICAVGDTVDRDHDWCRRHGVFQLQSVTNAVRARVEDRKAREVLDRSNQRRAILVSELQRMIVRRERRSDSARRNATVTLD